MMQALSVSTQLHDALERGIASARRRGAPTLVSASEPIERIDPLNVFRQSEPLRDRFYWRPASGNLMAGAGVAHSLTYRSSEQVERAWHQILEDAVICGESPGGPGPMLFGCLAFDPARPRTALWWDFPVSRLILPRYQVTVGTETWLTVNLLVGPDDRVNAVVRAVEDQIELLLADSPAQEQPPHGLMISTPGGEFCRLVEDAVRQIREESAQKIVVARAVEVRGSWDTAAIVERLAESQPHCTTFALAHGESCFLGATPEWLVRLHDGKAQISSLAGTAARGVTPQEDQQLGEALLASTKDRHEHALVLEELARALDGCAESMNAPKEPVLMKLRNLQHLFTPLTANVQGHTPLSLVERLHPTPAVAGLPRDAAMQFLREREGLDRGAYAGPIGWMDARGDGEFAVAIRSALLQEDRATAFAGCGIVGDSDPECEYAESQLKLRPILCALGAHGAS